MINGRGRKNRIDLAFARLSGEKRKALIGYVMAGYPTKAGFMALLPALERAGVDVLEVGIPFSDPIADGPTIQAAAQAALARGVTPAWVLASIQALRRRGLRLPIALMSYCNPIHAMGVGRFFRQAGRSGVDGLILPDSVLEESHLFDQAARRAGVHLIDLVAPTTPAARIRAVARHTRGFLYAVSLTGVTGARRALPAQAPAFLRSIRAVCRKPIAVGFGLSTPRQVQAIAPYADGVIIGSALIREIKKSDSDAFRGAARFVRSLQRALASGKDVAHAA